VRKKRDERKKEERERERNVKNVKNRYEDAEIKIFLLIIKFICTSIRELFRSTDMK